MVYHLAIIFEFIAVVTTLHRIYNKRMIFNIELLGLSLISLITVEVIRYYEISNMYTMIIYFFVGCYCFRVFEESFVGTSVSIFFMLIIVIILQYILMFPVSIFITKGTEMQMLFTNGLTAVVSLMILPKVKLHTLREIFRNRDIYIISVLSTVLAIVMVIILESKLGSQINLAYFSTAIPLIIIILWGLNNWNNVKLEAENSKNELLINISTKENYEDLLTAIRLRQHGFRNHLAALLSIKYTSKSYDELVEKQEQYYSEICEENKFNGLLLLGDSIIVGFLYKKFQIAEVKGIKVSYIIKGSFLQSIIPIYHLIDMFGILIDNAVEAQNMLEDSIKQLRFFFQEEKESYKIKISNPYPYMNFNIIESWFSLDKSTKGENRGIGLYNVKMLCEKFDAKIVCRNRSYENKNWIEFILEIRKADET